MSNMFSKAEKKPMTENPRIQRQYQVFHTNLGNHKIDNSFEKNLENQINPLQLDGESNNFYSSSNDPEEADLRNMMRKKDIPGLIPRKILAFQRNFIQHD